MAANEYHFITTWRIPARREEIADVLGDAPSLARWWPSVYLAVEVVEPGDPSGVGALVDLYTKGFLPYTLRWQIRVTRSDPPNGFALDASGDFVGHGIWSFEQDGPDAIATYDWQIFAEKGVLKTLSVIMKPIFAANHRWAMARGEESLRLELARRRATTLDARMRIPKPPGPTFPHNLRHRRAA
jgi:hypothetical protein